MKKFILFLIITLAVIEIYPQDKMVYIAEIKGDIDLGLVPYVKRAISDAEDDGIALVFEINTFGGRVDAATEIKDAIMAAKIPTYAFINNRAISAGALIALSCTKVIMVPGSSMGAATVVDQTGQKQSEKYQSYMRSEMRATAEFRGKNGEIAEGMVDESIVVKSLKDDSTKLITLTADEALKSKMSDGSALSIFELLRNENIKYSKIERLDSSWGENIVRFLNHPIVTSLLLMIGFLGIMVEIKTPGWGAGGTVAIIALALFFGANYILSLASIIEILLFVAGIALIAIEIFVIPGFGAAGIIGLILVVISIFMALVNSLPLWDMDQVSGALYQIAAALILSSISIVLFAKYLPKSKLLNKMVLSEEVSPAYEPSVHAKGFEQLYDMEGTAITTLRPAGIANIDNRRIDVITEGEFIDPGKKIKVIKVEGVKVVVKEITS